MRRLVPILLMVLNLLPRSASAGVFLSMERDLVDPDKGETPTLIVSFDDVMKNVLIRVTAPDGFKKEYALSSTKPGSDLRYSFSQSQGRRTYRVEVEMTLPDGEKDAVEQSFDVACSPPLTARIPPESVDLADKSFDVVTNHPPAAVDLVVLSDTMEEMGRSTFIVENAVRGKPARIRWTETRPGTVLKVSASVRDDFGYWTDVDILPWQLTIPHEDVVFATNQSEIPPDEAPKLEAAWGEIESAVRKYGELVTVTLWVGGYTDTVGDASDNQALSERRAMSLARWFKTRGYKAVVWYQGFGESVLAVQTADAVDEQRNRRALYVLTAGSPPSGADTPRSAWKKLP